MPRAEKEARVKGIAEQLSSAQAAVLAGYRGLTVEEAAELRVALAEVDTRFSVVKNSLTRRAVKEAGLAELDELIDGPTAIAYIQGDPLSAARRLVEQSRRFPVLEVRGGFAEGRILTAEDVRRFADLESREVMLARVAGMAKGQIARTAWMLQSLQSKFGLLMGALKERLPTGEAEAASPEDTPDTNRPGDGGQEPAEPQPAEPGPDQSEEDEGG
jgi:large subunit ribosomal protein L10